MRALSSILPTRRLPGLLRNASNHEDHAQRAVRAALSTAGRCKPLKRGPRSAITLSRAQGFPTWLANGTDLEGGRGPVRARARQGWRRYGRDSQPIGPQEKR